MILSKASYWEIEFIFPKKEPSYHLCFHIEPQTCLHIAPYTELFQDKLFDLVTIKNTIKGSLFLTIYPYELVNYTWVLSPWQSSLGNSWIPIGLEINQPSHINLQYFYEPSHNAALLFAICPSSATIGDHFCSKSSITTLLHANIIIPTHHSPTYT